LSVGSARHILDSVGDPPAAAGWIGLEHTMKDREAVRQATLARPHVDCKTLDLGVQGFAECLQQGPSACRYAVPFGYAFLCSDPRLCRGTVPGEPQRASGTSAGAADRRN
jgi:hypothetical protein